MLFCGLDCGLNQFLPSEMNSSALHGGEQAGGSVCCLGLCSPHSTAASFLLPEGQAQHPSQEQSSWTAASPGWKEGKGWF